MSEELFNPWTLPRPEIREDEREYTDPHHPGLKVKVKFRELNPFSEGQALRLYGEYYEKWVAPKSNKKGKEASPQMLPAPVPVLLNEIILDDLVLLQAMQVPGTSGQRYGLVEWVGFAVNAPDMFREMVNVCKGLNRHQEEQDEGNEGEPETTSGEQSSNRLSTTTNLILTGCSIQQDVSGASPVHSEQSPNGSESSSKNVETTQEPSIFGSSATTPA